MDTILSGEGALRRGGRWSPAGMRAVYCSETSSLAVLEILVGLPFGVDHPAYRIVDLTVPDDSIVHLDVEPAAPDSQSLGAAALSRRPEPPPGHRRTERRQPAREERRHQPASSAVRPREAGRASPVPSRPAARVGPAALSRAESPPESVFV